MPDSVMRAALARPTLITCGSRNQMNGSASRPIRAVNMSRTATLLHLKYFSTRYLSKCVEIAQRIGPENAKTSQDISVRLDDQLMGVMIRQLSLTNEVK